ncbi:eukaryotic translation initiation factor 4 gamma 3-like [Limulus polyphemus]|uniref:Eukaryotic translation initiation factor 4 gamma 3-like n=1 Tax=Limulus polyphemus TaxID=6850 RepID=A0ABM1B920_LIMPO|nr:eukaryotic translation initiation factor 4 gamma 3-like [Limulus polyphemus]
MSKPGPLPQQSVSMAGLQHSQQPQPIMPKPTVSGAGTVPHQQLSGPQTGITSFYPPSAQNVHNMHPSNLSTMNTNPSALNHAPQYQTQMGVIYPGNHTYGAHMAPQPVLMPGSVPTVPYHHRPQQYGTSSQHSLSTTHPHMFLTTANHHYAFNPQMQQQYYYSVVPSMMGPPAMPPLSQNVTSSTVVREKKILRLQDPNTGQDVTETILNSKESSSNTTNDNTGKEIIAQFATQVAAAATSITSKKEPNSRETPPQTTVSLVSTSAVVSPSTSSNITVLNNQSMQAETNHVSEKDISVGTSLKIDKVDKAINDDVTCRLPSEKPVGAQDGELEMSAPSKSNLNVPKLDVSPEKSTVFNSADEPDECISSGKADILGTTISDLPQESSSDVFAPTCSSSIQDCSELSINEPAEDMAPVSITSQLEVGYSNAEVVPSVDREVCTEIEMKHQQTLPENIQCATDDKPPTKLKPEMEVDKKEEKLDSRNSCVTEPREIQGSQDIGSALSTEEEKRISDNKKGWSKKKKFRELNKKGEIKDGGDLDAFVDKEEPVITTPVTESEVPITNEMSSVKPIEPPTSVSSAKDETEAPEEEQKVIERNEENSRVTVDGVIETEEKEMTEVEPPKSQITLKYNYPEDQWSPLNQEGKKQYDRAFLLMLQIQPYKKPQGLPNLDIIKDKGVQTKVTDMKSRPPPLQARDHPDPFVPAYARMGTPRLPPGGMNRRISQPSREKHKKVINISSSLNKDVKLHEAQNAWKPLTKVSKESGDDEAKTEELYKRVKGILNKLTPQKFQTLVSQVLELDIDTEERLKGVIDLVFQKAIQEPAFSVTYANLCKTLAVCHVTSSDGQQVKFKKLLLVKCQQEFEKDIDADINKSEYLKKIEEAETFRFIGELFKLSMLTPKIMDSCIHKLLSQQDEDSLECLCRLLTTVGKELEGDRGKNKVWTQQMDNYFKTMENIVKKRLTSSRIRFMLQDVIDLRKNNWVPRRDENNPKTIDQIHKEAKMEAQEQEMLLQQVIPQKRPEDRDRRKNRGNTSYSEDGWSTVSNKHRTQIDPNKIKQLSKNQQDTESIQLGPGGRSFSSWGRGSSGGTKPAAVDNEPKVSVPSNRFSALAAEQNIPAYESRRGPQRSTPSSRESSRGRASHFPPPSVRKTPSQTLPKEKEQLIETVKSFTKEKPKPEPKKIKEQALTMTDNSLKSGHLTEEEIDNKTKQLIDEFLHLQDFKEAVLCVSEVFSQSTICSFISSAINQVLERSSQARHLVGQLFHDLVRKNILSVEQYVEGLKSVLELADDFEIDIPKIWLYLGELVGPMIQDGSIPLIVLKDAAQPCVANGTAGKLLSAVLHVAAEKLGSIKVGELWRTSGLQWKDLLKPGENVDEFIQTNKLEFTLNDSEPQPDTSLSNEAIKKELNFLLQKKKANNEEILDWIEAHIGEKRSKDSQFIRVLVTTLVESAIEENQNRYELNKKVVAARTPIFQRYLDHKELLELEALYALQHLVHRLEHPKGLLREIFDVMYDEDLISDDAFTQWQKSDDPAEKEGKGVALKSVTSFFTWLEEAEQESGASGTDS